MSDRPELTSEQANQRIAAIGRGLTATAGALREARSAATYDRAFLAAARAACAAFVDDQTPADVFVDAFGVVVAEHLATTPGPHRPGGPLTTVDVVELTRLRKVDEVAEVVALSEGRDAIPALRALTIDRPGRGDAR